MANDLAVAGIPDQPTIEITLDNAKPVSLALLSGALDAISRDYRQFTGRDLSVVQIRAGSIIFTLADLASHANDLFDFAKNIVELGGLAVLGHAHLTSKRRKAAKSVLALAELAIASGHTVTLEYSETTKEIVKFTATPTDAARIITNSTPPPSSVEMPTPQIRYSGEIADVARRLASPEMAGREDVDEMRILLQALIAALRRQPGGRNAIEQLRNELVLDGHHDAAELLRQ